MSRDDLNESDRDEAASGGTRTERPGAERDSRPREPAADAKSGPAVVVPLSRQRGRARPFGKDPDDDDPGPAAA